MNCWDDPSPHVLYQLAMEVCVPGFSVVNNCCAGRSGFLTCTKRKKPQAAPSGSHVTSVWPMGNTAVRSLAADWLVVGAGTELLDKKIEDPLEWEPGREARQRESRGGDATAGKSG